MTNNIPLLTTKYLTDNNLWDGEWLEEKYKNNKLWQEEESQKD